MVVSGITKKCELADTSRGLRGLKNILVWLTPAYPARLNGIAKYAKTHGWYLTIQDKIVHGLSGWAGDGALVTMRNDPVMIDFVKNLRRRGVPVVDLTCNQPKMRIPRVIGDHAAIGEMAAEYFAEKNFKHSAWYSSDWMYIHKLRYDGFASHWDGDCPRRWVASEALPEGRLDNVRILSHWLKTMLKEAPKPLAVLAYDDSDAAQVLHVCLAEGISVPEEVAIIGIGNDEVVCEIQPVPITSVRHEGERTGFEGAALLDRLIDGQKAPVKSLMIKPTGIVERLSTDTVAVQSPFLREALRDIKMNLAKPMGIEQISARIGCPVRTLSELFAKELGHSCGKEINRQRIAKAKILLRDLNLNICEVSRECGFCDQAYFTNVFARLTGQTPKRFRMVLCGNAE